MEDKKKDIYEPLLVFSHAYGEALKSLNLQMLSIYSDKEFAKAINPLTELLKTTGYSPKVPNTLNDALSKISTSYAALFALDTLNDKIAPALVSLHTDSLFAMSNSVQTNMIKALKTSFATADYRRIIGILNDTMNCPTIKASDIAFMKTSGLVDAMGSDLKSPRGLATSLRDLNKATAYDISSNSSLEYRTGDAVFKSKSGEVNSKTLNMICSGKYIFTHDDGEVFSENELIDFCSFLSGTPTLAMLNDTGKKIFRFINTLYETEEKTIDFDKSTYYHCRSHKEGLMPYTFEEMLKAPHGLPWTGRYNHSGRSNYYFADTKKGAESEVKKHLAEDETLQTVQLRPIKSAHLLDLSHTLQRGKTFLRYLRFELSDVTNKTPREYLIPCFVSDCCKKIGFDGIKYFGSKEYNNYVVWNDGYFIFDGMC